MAEVADKIALLAGARYVETFTFEGALNFVLARLVNAWHTT